MRTANEFIRRMIEENGSVTTKQVHKGTWWIMMTGENEENGLLFPDAGEARVLESRHVCEGVDVQLIRSVCALPTETSLRRRWWCCVCEKGRWGKLRPVVNAALASEGSLTWRSCEVPWNIRRGVITSKGQNLEAHIACARHQEQLLSSKDADDMIREAECP